jgi:serine/threonine protein kinase
VICALKFVEPKN